MSRLRTHDVPEGVDPSDWTLRVTGAVSEPIHVDREGLSEFPLETVTDGFQCVEDRTVEDRSRRGTRVESVLDRAGPARLVPVAAGSDCWESVKWVRSLEVCDFEPIAGDAAEEITIEGAE